MESSSSTWHSFMVPGSCQSTTPAVGRSTCAVGIMSRRPYEQEQKVFLSRDQSLAPQERKLIISWYPSVHIAIWLQSIWSGKPKRVPLTSVGKRCVFAPHVVFSNSLPSSISRSICMMHCIWRPEGPRWLECNAWLLYMVDSSRDSSLLEPSEIFLEWLAPSADHRKPKLTFWILCWWCR